jgi:hypothetical protein
VRRGDFRAPRALGGRWNVVGGVRALRATGSPKMARVAPCCQEATVARTSHTCSGPLGPIDCGPRGKPWEGGAASVVLAAPAGATEIIDHCKRLSRPLTRAETLTTTASPRLSFPRSLSAQAGEGPLMNWIPASAGMTRWGHALHMPQATFHLPPTARGDLKSPLRTFLPTGSLNRASGS